MAINASKQATLASGPPGITLSTNEAYISAKWLGLRTISTNKRTKYGRNRIRRRHNTRPCLALMPRSSLTVACNGSCVCPALQ